VESRRLGAESYFVLATAPLDDAPNWTATVVVSERFASVPLRRARGWILLVFSLVLAGAGVATLFAIRHVAGPLRSLAHSIDRVRLGDLSARVPEIHRDEIGQLTGAFNSMLAEVERSREELKRTEAMRQELEIANRIQTALLPDAPRADGFEIAARMKPAEQVGGDLFDVLTFPDCFWVVIGDVSGHGLNAGLVMMIAQAAAYAAISEDPGRPARTVLAHVNRVLVQTVRRRMQRDDYVTLMVARHLGDGRFRAAGAHQPVFIARANGQVDVVDGAGPWCGVQDEIEPLTDEYEFALGPSDMVVLITDGVVEACSPASEPFGEERLAAALRRASSGSAREALERIFSEVEEFAQVRTDDMTVLALKRDGEIRA
jgi:sigma-B regulation protein RsbU (phosphoserine phosphatase)